MVWFIIKDSLLWLNILIFTIHGYFEDWSWWVVASLINDDFCLYFYIFPTVLSAFRITPLNASFTHLPDDVLQVYFWLTASLVWIIQWLSIPPQQWLLMGRSMCLMPACTFLRTLMNTEWHWVLERSVFYRWTFVNVGKEVGTTATRIELRPFNIIYKDLQDLLQPASQASPPAISSLNSCSSNTDCLYNLPLGML